MKPGDIIFLSASVPYRDGWIADAKPTEIEEAIISIARAVFARQGRLLFGGHPSISPLISAVAGEYFPPDPSRVARPVITFQSEFFRGALPDETWEMVRMGWSAIEWIPRGVADRTRSERAASLELMRRSMLLGPDAPREVVDRNQLAPPRTMIAVGGMDGVIEEAVMFFEHSAHWSGIRRVHAFKSGGGAAARLVTLDDQRPWPELTPGPEHRATLLRHWRDGDIMDVEDEWWRADGEAIPRTPVQPYAAMAQWLLDSSLSHAG
jgi:hypothetical protein